MYDATPDPYCYPGTRVLKNLANLTRASGLKDFDLALSTQLAFMALLTALIFSPQRMLMWWAVLLPMSSRPSI